VLLSNLADPILPIFMALMVGYGMRHLRFFDVGAAQTINRFVFYLAMPGLIFNLVAHIPFGDIDWGTMGVYIVSEAIVYGGSAWCARRFFKCTLGESILLGMAAGFVNHLMFVLPIAQSLHGSIAAQPIAAIVFIDVVVFALTVFAMDLLKASENVKTSGQRYHPGHVLGMLARNPMVLACGFGGIAAALFAQVPSGVFTYAKFVGASAAPAALFALGVILADRPVRPVGGAAWFAIGMKLIVHPAIFMALAGLVSMDANWETMGFLVAAGPCGAMPFVIALQYGVNPSAIAKAVLISTLLSLLSLSYLTAL
jgi:malonate transporter